jgi:hypothetical protein
VKSKFDGISEDALKLLDGMLLAFKDKFREQGLALPDWSDADYLSACHTLLDVDAIKIQGDAEGNMRLAIKGVHYA